VINGEEVKTMRWEPVKILKMAMQLIAYLAHFIIRLMRLSLECQLNGIYLTLI
jgi:hypothetical protein